MKKLTKLFTAIAFVSALALVGCANPSAPSTDTKPNPDTNVPDSGKPDASKQDKETFDYVVKNYSVPEVIVPSKASSGVPLETKIVGVEITWKTDNPNVITVEGKVTPKETTETVKLTATFTYKGYTATKEFNVKVYGTGSDIKIADADILKLAIDSVKPENKTETKENIEFSLPSTIRIHDNNIDFSKITISWELLSNDSNVKIGNKENQSELIITAKKIDTAYSFNYKATLTLNKATSTKEFSCTVDKLNNRFYVGTNKDTLSIYDNYIEVSDSRYATRTDADGNLYLKWVAVVMETPNGEKKWISIEDYRKIIQSLTLGNPEYTAMVEMLKNIEKNPTVEKLGAFLSSQDPNSPYYAADPYDYLVKIKAFGEDVTTVEQAKAKSAEEKKAAVIFALNTIKNLFGTQAGLAKDEGKNKSFDELFELNKIVGLEMNGLGEKETREFKAKLTEDKEKNTASLDAVFDTSIPFENQKGVYVGEKGERLSVNSPSGKIGYLNLPNPNNLNDPNDTIFYDVKFSNDYKNLVANDHNLPPKNMTIDYTNTDGHVKLTSTTETKSETYELTFKPDHLFPSVDR